MYIYLLWYDTELVGAYRSFDSALNQLLEDLRSDNEGYPQDYVRMKNKIFDIIEKEGKENFVYNDFYSIQGTWLSD